MKLKLSDGREYRLTVRHNPADEKGYRDTVAIMFAVPEEDGALRDAFVTGARCSPNDQFNRAKGRKIAATRMLSTLRYNGYSREDRRKVFDAICPEYRGRATSAEGAA